jgi:DNA polymerase V
MDDFILKNPAMLKPSGHPIRLSLPLVQTKVSAGFPSYADEHVELSLDLNEYLVPHPVATFFVRVTGESMTGAGIQDGDILIVDRSASPLDGSIVIALVDGEFTVKRLRRLPKSVVLVPENPAYPAMEIDPFSDFEVWGIVTHVIHSF